MTRARRVAAGVLAGALFVALGAATGALWSHAASQAGGMITGGDLHVETVEGTYSWTETTADVPAGEQQSGTTAEGLAGFVATPGDTLITSQGLHTRLTGDNIHARMGVDWAEPSRVPAGVTGRYRILDATGDQVVPGSGTTPLGTPSELYGLPAGDTTWTLEVTLTFTGTPAYTDPAADSSTTPPAEDGLGVIEVRLDQVRSGIGFTP